MRSKALCKAMGYIRHEQRILIPFTLHNLRPILFQIAKKAVPDPYSSQED